MWPASVCGQPAWVAATQPGPRRRASTAGVTQPGGLGRPNQAGSPSPSVLPGPGNPGRPGWPAPPNQGGRAAQPVCLGHPASSRQAYGRLAGHPGPPGQPGRRCCRSPPAASRGSLPWPSTARGAARGALAKVAALARARGRRRPSRRLSLLLMPPPRLQESPGRPRPAPAPARPRYCTRPPAPALRSA